MTTGGGDREAGGDWAEVVAYWSQEVRAATAYRDDAIRAWRGDGASLRQIAAAAEMHHSAIAKIVGR